MTVREALALADGAAPSLVEISPGAEPPVCKVLDFGKYKFRGNAEEAAEARKKQKVVELKEVKLRPGIDDHDFDIKMKNARSFLEDGDKVRKSPCASVAAQNGPPDIAQSVSETRTRKSGRARQSRQRTQL